ncbi:MAG: glucose-6-phosphate isomerase [Bacteroidales bacterium]|nr:glucose-6-phosphate isomerase [Bacteroidales bacterium]
MKIEIENVSDYLSMQEIICSKNKICKSYKSLIKKTGVGADFTGWLELPLNINKKELADIHKTARQIRNISDIFVVVGIGGSYLGSRAVIEALSHHFQFLMPQAGGRTKVLYAGNNISGTYLADLTDVLNKYDYSMAVISKSGTTLEPAIAFRVLKTHIENHYKHEAKNRIIAITDKTKGALKGLADKEGYKTFVIPDDIGGRYSVLTPVGLLPIAVAGYDIEELIRGAADMQKLLYSKIPYEQNPAVLYALARNFLYQKGKAIEIMVAYEPSMFYFIEWWKQLFGESEGKEGKGIFPGGMIFTTDLHSLGQYVQEGSRNIFETVLSVEKSRHKLYIQSNEDNIDGLDYISGKDMNEVNLAAELGTAQAHKEGAVPQIRISIPELNEYNLGQLIYFFEFSCALSAYYLGVNPFNQPGVEAYKKNMYKLLGKK